MELQQQPICRHEQWKFIRSVFRSRSLRSDRAGQDADINRSIPSSPLQLRGGQLVLLPPEWAPCQTRQWHSQTKEKPYSTEILQPLHTAIVLHSTADTRVIGFHHVTDEVNISPQLTLQLQEERSDYCKKCQLHRQYQVYKTDLFSAFERGEPVV